MEGPIETFDDLRSGPELRAQDEEIERLKKRLGKCEAALRTAQQALSEIDHARKNPEWFTRGESAAWQQTTLWIDRAAAAIRAALEK